MQVMHWVGAHRYWLVMTSSRPSPQRISVTGTRAQQHVCTMCPCAHAVIKALTHFSASTLITCRPRPVVARVMPPTGAANAAASNCMQRHGHAKEVWSLKVRQASARLAAS